MWKFTGTERPSFAELPRPGQESVWDYPRPPQCVADSRTVIVKLGDQAIARSNQAVRVLETASPPTFYIPPSDVDFKLLTLGVGRSFCEWKGAATYWSVAVEGQLIKNAGWSYQNPTRAFATIAGYVSFYPALLNCTVDGEAVRPQPGEFYGGWVTNEIVGPFKGEPGTGGW